MMAANWPWSELGIAPTPEAAAIRRAYAERLKQTRPDEDPEGFAKLRAAYENALRRTGPRPRPSPPEFLAARPETPAAEPPGAPSPQPPADDVPEFDDAAARRVVEAFNQRDIVGAAGALAAGRATGELSIAQEFALFDRLLAILAGDLTLPGSVVIEAARRLGWQEAQSAVSRSPLADRLYKRVRAERWLIALRQMAGSWRFLIGSQRAAAARLLLGRSRLIPFHPLPPEPPLTQLLAEFRFHEAWIGSAFDPQPISSVERIAKGRYLWLVRLFPVVPPLLIAVGAIALGAKGAAGLVSLTAVVSTYARGYYRALLGGLAALTLVASIAQFSPLTNFARTAANDPASLKQRAEANDLGAAFALGARYAQGNGVPKDPKIAAEWFRRALKGPPEAAGYLGFLYEHGQGVPQDLEQARNLYLDAAQRGEANAQANLATLLRAGRGGPTDVVQAFHWESEAAKRGNVRGLNGVGYAYLVGSGVERDPARAFRWLTAAAQAGQPNAMHSLAFLYSKGLGTPASTEAAYYWLSLAARTYPPTDEHLQAAKSALPQIAALLSDAERERQDEALRAWAPKPAKAPE